MTRVSIDSKCIVCFVTRISLNSKYIVCLVCLFKPLENGSKMFFNHSTYTNFDHVIETKAVISKTMLRNSN